MQFREVWRVTVLPSDLQYASLAGAFRLLGLFLSVLAALKALLSSVLGRFFMCVMVSGLAADLMALPVIAQN